MLRSIGQKGIDLIVSFEKEVLHVYDDGYGYPTLGVGHLLTAVEKKAMPIGTPITRDQSREYFKNDLKKYIDAVNEAITKPCTQNEFDAMVSLCFNIGIGAFKGSSVVRRFNAGDKDGAANAFLSWNKAKGKVSKGLVRRRNVERTLFLNSAAPTAPTNSPSGQHLTEAFSSETAIPPPKVIEGEAKTEQPKGDSADAPAVKVTQNGMVSQIIAAVGGLTTIGSGVWAYIIGNPTFAVVATVCLTIIILALLDRWKKTDVARMEAASNPDRYNVK